jgi:hypothetical protein
MPRCGARAPAGPCPWASPAPGGSKNMDNHAPGGLRPGRCLGSYLVPRAIYSLGSWQNNPTAINSAQDAPGHRNLRFGGSRQQNDAVGHKPDEATSHASLSRCGGAFFFCLCLFLARSASFSVLRLFLSKGILRQKKNTSSETDQWRQARARAWASGNKLAPQKANSRRKMFKCVLGQFYGPF